MEVSFIFLVLKKGGTFSSIIDFRRVNEVTVDDHYPFPVFRDLLMCLEGGNKVFSSLDLLSGHWQLPIAPESREGTAFSTSNGHFEWARMPFGLTCQRTMNNIFGDMLGNTVYIYLDDIITLKLKLIKCEFLKPRIKFLGHEVDEKGIHTVDDKIAAVAKFPQPKTVENVR